MDERIGHQYRKESKHWDFAIITGFFLILMALSYLIPSLLVVAIFIAIIALIGWYWLYYTPH